MNLLCHSFVFFFVLFSTTSATSPKKNPKRGLTYAATNNSDIRSANNSASTVSWVYDWGATPPPYLASSGLEYIPMQWGASGIENFAATVKAQNATTILTFNEPDFVQESNINATYAAQLWMQYIEPMKNDGIRLGGPAISAGGTGRPWLVEFLAACTACTIDFIPFHWYGEGSGGFYDYIWQMHGQFPNYTFWITEYADTSLNQSVVLQTLNETTVYLDNLTWVERYAWFGYFRPANGSDYNLLDVNGNLNALGQVYVDNATKVVDALPNPTTFPASSGAATGGGYITISGAPDSTPAFITSLPNGALSSLGRDRLNQILWASGTLVLTSLLSAAWTLR